MKRFLSDYGFTILAAIVVITLITFSSPISSAIQKQIANAVQSLGKVANNDLNKIDDSASLIDLTNINKSGVVGDFSRKGNLVTINNTQYRVLEVNGPRVKVMSMISIGSSTFNSSSVTTSFGSKTGQKYASSNLDNAMISYYNSLPSAIQDAIVEQNINQSMYNWNGGTSASASFSAWCSGRFTTSTSSGTNYYLTRVADINVGSRKVYALDVDDVIAYLGSNSTPQDVNELFWNQRSFKSSNVWLRSARSGSSNFAFRADGGSGYLYYIDYYSNSCEVRPAFVLNLRLLS